MRNYSSLVNREPWQVIERLVDERGIKWHPICAVLAKDPNTVRTWRKKGHVIEARHREKIAEILRVPVTDIWPDDGAGDVE